MAHPIAIRTAHLTVRELAHDDLPRFLLMSSDPDVVRFLSFGPTSEAEARGMIDFAVASASERPRTHYVLAVDDATTAELIGSCGLALSDDEPADAEISFAFCKDAWGHGYGVEVLRALIDLAFDSLGLSRVYGQAHPGNRHSIAAMERSGMTYDGDSRDPPADERDGQVSVRYAILRTGQPFNEAKA